MRKPVVFSFLMIMLYLTSLTALDYAPWFERSFEIQGRLSVTQQAYPSVNARGSSHYSSQDYFIDGSLSVPLLDVIGAEIECGLLDTHRHSFGFGHLTLMGRYSLESDCMGDPYSLMIGAALTQVFKRGLNDISVFYHGGIEFGPHVSIGKEMICEEFWTSRSWGLFGLGIADHGYPWVRADLQWDNNHWDRHQWSLFMHSLWGCGSHALRIKSFHGYGSIQHQSIDVGGRYQYVLCSTAILGAEYAFRVFARNCPRFVNQVMLSFLYPFGF